jgi:hypothetical protein
MWNNRGFYEMPDGSAVLPTGAAVRGPTALGRGGDEQAATVIAAGAPYATPGPTATIVTTPPKPGDRDYVPPQAPEVSQVAQVTPQPPSAKKGGWSGFSRDLVNRVSSWQNLTPWKEEKGETYGTAAKQTLTRENAIIAAEVLVPVVYTARNWNKMSNGAKALSLGMDLLSVVPVLGAAGKGAREAAAVTKMARLSAAGKAVAAESARQVLWPVEMVKSIQGLGRQTIVVGKDSSRLVSGVRAVPQNTKAALSAVVLTQKEMMAGLENFVRPTKLPESVVISTMHSAKIPVGALKGSGKETMAVRDALMAGLKKSGSGVTIETADSIFELHLTPLMKKTGGVAHGAADITVFESGLVIKRIPGKAAIEQKLFAAPVPIGKYMKGESAFGQAVKGKPGAIVLNQDFFMRYGKSSRKLYRMSAEGETVFDVGRKTPPVVQKLFTRIDGQRCELWLTQRLSKTDILKLKLAGLTEGVKTLYQPTIEIKGAALKGLTKGEIDELARIVNRTDRQVARNLEKIRSAARARPNALPSMVLRARSGVKGKATLVRVQTRVESPRGDGKAPYRVRTSRQEEKIIPRRDQTLDEAITERLDERRDSAEREGYVDVARTPRSESPRSERIPETRREGGREETPPRLTRETPEDRGRAPDRDRPYPPRRVSPPERARVPGMVRRVPRGGGRTPVGRIDTPRPPQTTRIRPPLEPEKLSEKALEGATAFKQGWCYWTVLRDGRSIPSAKPIEGVPIMTGKGSPQASLTTFGLGINGKRQIEMGKSVATVYDPPGKAKPTLTYVPRKSPQTKAKKVALPRLSR